MGIFTPQKFKVAGDTIKGYQFRIFSSLFSFPIQGKISKAEDAPLMDNEYNLGSATPPTKSPVKNGGATNILPSK